MVGQTCQPKPIYSLQASYGSIFEEGGILLYVSLNMRLVMSFSVLEMLSSWLGSGFVKVILGGLECCALVSHVVLMERTECPLF